MAKKQTRGSISINRKLHDKATSMATSLGIPVSQICEAVLANVLMLTDQEIIDIVGSHRAGAERERLERVGSYGDVRALRVAGRVAKKDALRRSRDVAST